MSVASMIARAAQMCQFQAPTRAKSALGANTQATFVARGAAIPCWLQPASGQMIEAYQRRGIEITHCLYCETDPGTEEGDRVTIGTRRFLMQAVLDQAGLGRVYKFVVKEMNPNG